MIFTKAEQNKIMANTIIDSGVIYPTSWHSKDNKVVVTYRHISGAGILTERMYFVNHGSSIYRTLDQQDAVNYYSRLILAPE